MLLCSACLFIKFDLFVKEAKRLGADYIATGHYAKMKDGKLYKAKDENKDQTYDFEVVNDYPLYGTNGEGVIFDFINDFEDKIESKEQENAKTYYSVDYERDIVNRFDLYQKTVGVIGTGKIGMAFINICLGFGMKVLAYDPYPKENVNFEYEWSYKCGKIDSFKNIGEFIF